MTIRTVAVVGAGVMGSGIAQVLATGRYDVHLADLNQATVDRARERIEHGRFGLRQAVERDLLSSEDADAALARITGGAGLPPADVDLVIEAVFEDLDVKLGLFRELDDHLQPHTVIASNSSGFPVSVLAGGTNRADRVLVWHFASPVSVMALAEIVAAPATSPATIDAVVEVARRIGKNPVVIADQPLAWGYVTNRVLTAAAREADRIVAEGIAAPEQVDQLLKDCFRWPSGLFEMLGATSSNWEEEGSAPPDELTESARRLVAFMFPALVAHREPRP